LEAPFEGAVFDNASKTVKGRLTGLSRHFFAAQAAFSGPLTARTQLIIVPPMHGLNHICGICREIIR
jgi:hypothetical protein